MSRWYDGSSYPLNQIGNDEDYYLQLPNGDVFRKRYGSWNKIGSIKGVKGDIGRGIDGHDGTDGVDGNKWTHGVGIPSDELGMCGDYYVDLNTKDIFQKNDALMWERVGSLLPDGRRAEFRNYNGSLDYRYEGEDDNAWRPIVTVEELKGIKGDQGEIGLTPSITHLENLIHDKVLELDDGEMSRIHNELLREGKFNKIISDHAKFEENEIGRYNAETQRQSSELDRQERERQRENSIVSMEHRVATSIAAGTVDLEVIDARVSQDGTVYDCLSQRISAIETKPYIWFEDVEG